MGGEVRGADGGPLACLGATGDDVDVREAGHFLGQVLLPARQYCTSGGWRKAHIASHGVVNHWVIHGICVLWILCCSEHVTRHHTRDTPYLRFQNGWYHSYVRHKQICQFGTAELLTEHLLVP